MFDEPEEKTPDDRPMKPADRALEKADEFRMHAELCAVFEGTRKFEAEIVAGLDAALAREAQKLIAKLEKSRRPDVPLLPEESFADARKLLGLFKSSGLDTNHYHVYRRPGEAMILRWLAGEQVEAFYARLQAHVDAALTQYRTEQRESEAWKQDPETLAYLDALDAVEIKMAERYLRQIIRQHRVFILSTQTADEMDILHLCDAIMGVAPGALVGSASAPPDEPTERDRAWFFKLFCLRGIVENEERMFFFTYLQKAEDTFDMD